MLINETVSGAETAIASLCRLGRCAAAADDSLTTVDDDVSPVPGGTAPSLSISSVASGAAAVALPVQGSFQSILQHDMHSQDWGHLRDELSYVTTLSTFMDCAYVSCPNPAAGGVFESFVIMNNAINESNRAVYRIVLHTYDL
jgi:hypothetical protein